MPGKIGAGAFWTGMVDFVGGKSAQDVATDIQKAWDAHQVTADMRGLARSATLLPALDPGLTGPDPSRRAASASDDRRSAIVRSA